jgi:hypothetical protein
LALTASALAALGCRADRTPSPDATSSGALRVRSAAETAPIAPSSAAPSLDATTPAGPESGTTARRTLAGARAADVGALACKLLRPPIMQTYGGSAAIRFAGADGADAAPELVFNDQGRPRVSIVPRPTGSPAADVPLPPKSTLPRCAVARDVIFCADASGAIRRTVGKTESDVVVAQSRAGTPIAAASIGGEHVLLAFLVEALTSEGLVREARVMLDDGLPLRLSEEGSGATSIELASRGEDVVALIIDGRVAMTPAHIRILRVDDGKLRIGRDAVVFVGGAAERHNGGALALTREGKVFALLPVAETAETFGMAAIRLSDPPTEDEPVVWSYYPNGLDPASIAASRGVSPIRVARVRPSGADPDASRVLEVGELAPSGEFEAKCIISEAAYIKDVALEIDRQGALWLFWRDPRGSHFERRALPAPPGRGP